MTAPEEEIEFLFRSPNRVDTLAVLEGRQAATAHELDDELDISRRTIVRILNDLEDRQYIQKTTDGWVLTQYGSGIFQSQQRFYDDILLAQEYRMVLANIDQKQIELELELLRETSLTLATDVRPYAPLERVTQLHEEATEICILSPNIEMRSSEQVSDRIREDDEFQLELIISRDTLEILSQPTYRPQLELLLNSEKVTSSVYPGEVPCFLGVIDDVAALGVIVDGKPEALVEGESPRFREWVVDHLDAFRAESMPLEDCPRV